MIPVIVTELKNLTRHKFQAEAVAIWADPPTAGPIEIRIAITQGAGYVDPLQKELEDTRAVMGDLAQEKLVGVKVYAVARRFSTAVDELVPYVFLTLQAAEKMVESREGKFITWTEHNGHGRCWMSDRYTITELEIA